MEGEREKKVIAVAQQGEGEKCKFSREPALVHPGYETAWAQFSPEPSITQPSHSSETKWDFVMQVQSAAVYAVSPQRPRRRTAEQGR